MPIDDFDNRVTRLIPREREIMDLLVVGQAMKQIAAKLQISLSACSKHRTSVLEKLEVENDVEPVRLIHAWQTPPQ